MPVTETPFGVVTFTLTRPAVWPGALAVSVVSLMTVMLVASVPPNVTAVAPVKFVPVIVTLVMPDTGAVGGTTLATVGGNPYVYAPVPVTDVPFGVLMITSAGPDS